MDLAKSLNDFVGLVLRSGITSELNRAERKAFMAEEVPREGSNRATGLNELLGSPSLESFDVISLRHRSDPTSAMQHWQRAT